MKKRNKSLSLKDGLNQFLEHYTANPNEPKQWERHLQLVASSLRSNTIPQPSYDYLFDTLIEANKKLPKPLQDLIPASTNFISQDTVTQALEKLQPKDPTPVSQKILTRLRQAVGGKHIPSTVREAVAVVAQKPSLSENDLIHLEKLCVTRLQNSLTRIRESGITVALSPKTQLSFETHISRCFLAPESEHSYTSAQRFLNEMNPQHGPYLLENLKNHNLLFLISLLGIDPLLMVQQDSRKLITSYQALPSTYIQRWETAADKIAEARRIFSELFSQAKNDEAIDEIFATQLSRLRGFEGSFLSLYRLNARDIKPERHTELDRKLQDYTNAIDLPASPNLTPRSLPVDPSTRTITISNSLSGVVQEMLKDYRDPQVTIAESSRSILDRVLQSTMKEALHEFKKIHPTFNAKDLRISSLINNLVDTIVFSALSELTSDQSIDCIELRFQENAPVIAYLSRTTREHFAILSIEQSQPLDIEPRVYVSLPPAMPSSISPSVHVEKLTEQRTTSPLEGSLSLSGSNGKTRTRSSAELLTTTHNQGSSSDSDY